MKKHSKALIYAAIIGLIIVAIFLGFLTSFTNPVSWVLVLVLLLIPFIYNKTSKNDLLQWKDEYSVGVETLDLDHKKLINLLNQFITAYDYAMSEEYERQALMDLVEYTKYHFSREEKLMEDSGYEDLVEHKKQHQQMVDKIVLLTEKYEKHGHACFNEICTFLKAWLINHINGTDKQYTEHLNASGIK